MVWVFDRRKKVIKSDEDALLIHYYLQRGFTPEYIMNLSFLEKQFFTASAELETERENEKWQRLLTQ